MNVSVLVVSHPDGSLSAQELHTWGQVVEWAEVLEELDPYRNAELTWVVRQETTVRDAR